MRCTCQSCGEYMVQDEKGLFSRCICPNCFQTCAACLGTQQTPLSADALRALVAERAQYDRVNADAADGGIPQFSESDDDLRLRD